MNSGSRNGQAVGFEISYLPKLSSTKDVENRQTLLHYLVETVEAKFPDVLNFDEELIHLDKAARVSVETIQKSLRIMDSDLKNLETDLKTSKVPQSADDKFHEVMSVSVYYLFNNRIHKCAKFCIYFHVYFYDFFYITEFCKRGTAAV